MSSVELNLPPCASSCFTESASNATCAGLDHDCICANAAFTALTNACIPQSCTAREILTTQDVTSTFCGISPKTNYSYEPVIIVFLTLASIAFLLRASTRLLLNVSVWWDDVCSFCALLGLIALSGITLSLKHLGFGLDIWAVPLDNISKILLGQYVTGILYTATRYFIRASILIFYLRIFTLSTPRILSIATVIVIVMEGVTFTVTTIFECTPVDTFWLQWDGQHAGRCVNLQSLLWANIALGIIGDFWIISFPMVFVSRLKLRIREKFQVSVMFGVGITVTGLNIARIPALKLSSASTNSTLDNVPITILSVVENSVGIICVCLPSIRILLRHLLSERQQSGKGSSIGATYAASSQAGTTLLTHPESDGPHRPDPSIRITTTIQRKNIPYESEPDVALNDLHLVGTNRGAVEVQAWA
ncbi:hypothetical protein F4804DRAFT_320019 [Jackrogersella minutella]|nr:hypothetical protein F4804DRAFT_320019 [Jackrogersella minutella]